MRPQFRRSRRLPFSSVPTLVLLLALSGSALAPHLTGAAAAPVKAAVTTNEIAVAPPPMGWASWNTFAAKIDYNTIKAQADALVSSGLAAAGYQYVNIDAGWWQGTRDSSGTITVDSAEWPGGMQAIADYVHSKGLKAGIYTDAGRDGCGYYYPTGRPAAPGSGSEGHYDRDFLTFAQWGFDFVKVDWCGGAAEGLNAETQYRQIGSSIDRAAHQTGRRLVLSICDWGEQSPWNWGPGVGTMWRTNTDIIYYGETASMSRVFTALDANQHPTAQHTGYHNDPDMMVVGMPNFTAAQNRTHMSLWAISGAPILAGNNLATMSSGTAAILANAEVIAIDQDRSGLPAVKIAEDAAGLQVYTKVLSGHGRRAVALLNRTGAAAAMTVRLADLGLTGSASIRNVWAGGNAGPLSGSYTVSVPANEAVLLTVTGTDAAATVYEAEATANTRGGSAATAACAACSGGSEVGQIGNGTANTLRFNDITSANGGPAVVTIAYVNGDTTVRTATLSVPGSADTVVAFPPTGSWTTPGTVSVVVSLARGSGTTLTFGNATTWAPDLDAVGVSSLGRTRPDRR